MDRNAKFIGFSQNRNSEMFIFVNILTFLSRNLTVAKLNQPIYRANNQRYLNTSVSAEFLPNSGR